MEKLFERYALEQVSRKKITCLETLTENHTKQPKFQQTAFPSGEHRLCLSLGSKRLFVESHYYSLM